MDDSQDLRKILDALPLMFFQKDKANNIVRTNKATAMAANTTVEEMVGTPATLWFADETGALTKHDQMVMKSNKPELGSIISFQGHRLGNRWIIADKFPHHDASDNVDGLLVFVRDVTAQQEAIQERLDLEGQLQETQKLEGIGVLAAGVAHDFNNHLMAILGNAELTDSLVGSNHVAAKHLQKIIQSSRQAAEICNQLLTYAGQKQFHLIPTDVSSLIIEIKELLNVSISKKAVLTYDLSENLPFANVDAPQVSQILVNLITNASDAMGGESGQITLSTSSRYCHSQDLLKTKLGIDLPVGEYVVISVEDSGFGMTEEKINQIFEPFYTTKEVGRGLGLATVLGTIRSHSGTLGVSSSPGKGTLVELLFPVTQQDENVTTPKVVAPMERRCGTVLLADDVESVRDVLTSMLERGGYTVLVATNGIEAVEMFRRHEGCIEAAILDYSMPGQNGIEAFSELIQLQSELPVLFSTGYPEQLAIGELDVKHHVDFIQKPYTSNELLWRLDQLIP